MSNTGRQLARGLAQDPGLEVHYRSAALERAALRVKKFAANARVPILLIGESGTGKTRWARMIHEQSPRSSGPFQTVVLSALDDALASAALFGHVAGAFTGAYRSRPGGFVCAHRGTLFLDEIGKCSLPIQRELLHAVEAREIQAVGSDRDLMPDVRIVTASNVPLNELVEKGLFLDDLYARLETFCVCIPPLRECRADIPQFVSAILSRRAAEFGYEREPSIDRELMTALCDAAWPHNLRQLDATIQRLLIEANGARVLTLALCCDDLAWLKPRGRRDRLSVEEVTDALNMAANNKTRAAQLLAVDRRTLHRFIRRSGMR